MFFLIIAMLVYMIVDMDNPNLIFNVGVLFMLAICMSFLASIQAELKRINQKGITINEKRDN